VPWLHAVIDAPADQLPSAAAFWAQAFGWPPGDHWPGHPELRSFEPPSGSAYVHLQQIDGPARVHVDLASDAPRQCVQSALDLGARLVAEHDDWHTLSSPGGLLFCVCAPGAQERPAQEEWPGGHHSRLVQVCIDSPRTVHDTEVSFWRELLGPTWSASVAPEFAGKWHDGVSPVQLLFQVLDEEAGRTRAHLDLGADDVAAEVRRLGAMGAADLGPGRGWHVLQDATGQPFCVTANSPA
jgi:hypothetical protein